jgi:hypothetical protein
VKITEICPTLAGVAQDVFLRATVTATVVPLWPAPGEILEMSGAGEIVNGEAALLVNEPAVVEPAILMPVLGIAAAVASDDGNMKTTFRAVAAVVVLTFGVTVVAANVTGLPFPKGGVIVTVTLLATPANPVAFSCTVCPAYGEAGFSGSETVTAPESTDARKNGNNPDRTFSDRIVPYLLRRPGP